MDRRIKKKTGPLVRNPEGWTKQKKDGQALPPDYYLCASHGAHDKKKVNGEKMNNLIYKKQRTYFIKIKGTKKY